jgi:hypothetical protein
MRFIPFVGMMQISLGPGPDGDDPFHRRSRI